MTLPCQPRIFCSHIPHLSMSCTNPREKAHFPFWSFPVARFNNEQHNPPPFPAEPCPSSALLQCFSSGVSLFFSMVVGGPSLCFLSHPTHTHVQGPSPSGWAQTLQCSPLPTTVSRLSLYSPRKILLALQALEKSTFLP